MGTVDGVERSGEVDGDACGAVERGGAGWPWPRCGGAEGESGAEILRRLFPEIIGAAPPVQALLRLVQRAAAASIAVLVEGETGTGKELVARALHRASSRVKGPFIAVNCAAVPGELLEGQLFGHCRGAFTGALRDQVGVFEAAHRGTILLDEIGDMPLLMQAKLLRVLEDGHVVRVGETRPRAVDVRLVSATNRDLRYEVGAGRFREDLYYRIAALRLHLPPLRARREDIPCLASHFLAAAAARYDRRAPRLHPLALEALLRADWPGNVRELKNAIDRAVVVSGNGELIEPAHLALSRVESLPATGRTRARYAICEPDAASPLPLPSAPLLSLRTARAAFEAQYVAEALRRSGGNVSQAARTLNLSRVVLHKKIRQYGLR